MNSFVQDIRYALRNLRSNPGFTVVALLALALGVGANSAIFTVVHAVLLRPLPYPDSERLVYVVRQWTDGGTSPALSGTRYIAWTSGAKSFESAAAFDFVGGGINLAGDGAPERIPAIRVTSDFFKTFGVQPAIGRGFAADDGKPGAAKVVVVSDGLWRRRFGGDPGLLGRSLLLSGTPHQVIGIMPPGFESEPKADVWSPMYLQADPNDQSNQYWAVARLKPGVTLEQAKAEMPGIYQPFKEQYPKLHFSQQSIGLYRMREYLTRDVRPALLILLGAVGLVLLIACANVANLLLARSTARSKEMAVRAALGAARSRIIRQLLTESVILALGGAVAGLLLASWLLRLLLQAAPQNLPRLTEIGVDSTVIAATIGLSLLTAVIFGLAPALQASKVGLNEALRESGRGSSGGAAKKRLRGVLVIIEVAFCVVLVIAATLLIRSFAGLRNVDTGFSAGSTITFKMSVASSHYRTAADFDNFSREVVRRIESIPGVQAAATVTALPLELGPDRPYDVEGLRRDDGLPNGDAQWRSVTPNYFKALGIPLKAGRYFAETDTGTSQPVIVINETLARNQFKNRSPIGERITIGRIMGPSFADSTRVIVGVVGDVKERGLHRRAPEVTYLPVSQAHGTMTLGMATLFPSAWIVRTSSSPYGLMNAIQREVQAVDPQIPLAEIRAMGEVLDRSIAQRRFNMLLLSLFAVLALTLAIVGIYGVISYSVTQRTQEIGIRMALGAGSRETLGMVLNETLKLAAAGVALGVIAAFGLTRLMTSLLFGVAATDPPTYLIAVVLLFAAAALACLIPARRAMLVDPIVALRYE